MMFRVSRGLVMTTIDTVRCQPLWNQLFCQRVFVAGPPSPAWQNERNSNWTPIFELRTDIRAEQARDELICGDAFVWSLVIRSVVTRCGDWPIRGQHSDTWPIRRGDNDHIWQPASTIGSKKVLNPFWAIIPLLSAGHIHYRWPHLRQDSLSPGTMDNVFCNFSPVFMFRECFHLWELRTPEIMITVSLCNPLSSLSRVLSFLSPLLQPISPASPHSGPHLIPCPSHRRHQEGQHVMLILEQKTKGGEPNHFIIFLLYFCKKPLVYEVGISYGLDTWSLCVSEFRVCVILNSLTTFPPHSSLYTNTHRQRDNAKINCEGTGGFMVCVTVAGLAALTPISFSCPIQFCG